ncbi:hypothetical protein FM112_07760 [Gulosibacter sp. 10]|nr:hypothetical protein FM112_07760 [Gulosibacter sp. 10]
MLAALAAPPESVVEAAARRVDPAAWDESLWQCGGLRGVMPDSEGANAAREEARGIAETVLAALAGGEVDVSAS